MHSISLRKLGCEVMAAAAVLGVLHFVLIHGAAQGAWSWYHLEDQLLKAGHNVTSFDLTGAGINPVDPNTITTWEEYHKPALDFFQSLEPASNEKVVLVGHSVAGIALLTLMERFPQKIDLAVFVASVVVPSGVSLLQDQPLEALLNLTFFTLIYDNGNQNPPTSLYIPTPDLQNVFYNGLASEIVVLASKLVRPFPYLIGEAITYTGRIFRQVPSVYIRFLQDHTVNPAASEYIATHYGPFREVVALDGGHFDFLRIPKQFTKLLEGLGKKYT